MAATLKQRQIAADVLRAKSTQPQAADAAGVGLSTIKRWLQQPDFLAMVESSPDIRVGATATIRCLGATSLLLPTRRPVALCMFTSCRRTRSRLLWRRSRLGLIRPS